MVCKVNYCKHKLFKISVLNEKLFIANSGRIAMLLLSPKFGDLYYLLKSDLMQVEIWEVQILQINLQCFFYAGHFCFCNYYR